MLETKEYGLGGWKSNWSVHILTCKIAGELNIADGMTKPMCDDATRKLHISCISATRIRTRACLMSNARLCRMRSIDWRRFPSLEGILFCSETGCPTRYPKGGCPWLLEAWCYRTCAHVTNGLYHKTEDGTTM